MKKAFIILAVIVAVVVVGMSVSTPVEPQPANVSQIVPRRSQVPPVKTNPTKTQAPTTRTTEDTLRPQTNTIPSKEISSDPKIEVVNIKQQPTATTSTTQPTLQTIDTTSVTGESSIFSNLFGRRKEHYWCQDNGNGTVTYGTANWVCDRRVLFCVSGHWDYGIPLTMPGNTQTCSMFLEGVPTIVAP